MKKIVQLILLVSTLSSPLLGQELKCNISVNSSKIQGTNRTTFQTLQTALYEFMNNTNWTDNVFSTEERIECNIQINLTDQTGSDQYKGTIQVQSRRPVYGSSYNTVLLNFLDNDLDFKYIEFDKLEFNENTQTSNLTSILAYYAYIIIGLDYDSFSYKGGTPYFLKAEKIVNNAQNATEKGWKPYEGSTKNRYWLVEDILNEKYSPIREVYYDYHRLGLDVMADKTVEGRAEIAESLVLLQKVYRDKPDPYLFFLQVFLDAKSDELVNIFSESYMSEKTRVYNILAEIDPTRIDSYKKLTEQTQD
ncbi:MAG TPA: DUF4835 family protein [Williamwhitmania sp.]|nr:DUF4835 family protein [Williamwhitmania sp.]